MPRNAGKRQRRLLIPSHPELSRAVVEPLLFFLAVGAFFALVIVILVLVT